MATKQRNPPARPRSPAKRKPVLNISPAEDRTPWAGGDPDKKISINVPFPETLMLQMEWLLEQRAIRSKSSFIRDAVAEIATREAGRAMRVQEAVRRMEEEDGRA